MLQILWTAIGSAGRFDRTVRWLNVSLLIVAGFVGSAAAYSQYFTVQWPDPSNGDEYRIAGGWFTVLRNHKTQRDEPCSMHANCQLDPVRALKGAALGIPTIQVTAWNIPWHFHRSSTHYFFFPPIQRWGTSLWTTRHSLSLQWLCLGLGLIPLMTISLNATGSFARRYKSPPEF